MKYEFVPDENSKPESNMIRGKIVGFPKYCVIDIYVDSQKTEEDV